MVKNNAPKRLNDGLGDQLRKLLPNTRNRNQSKQRTSNPMPSPMLAGEDGVNHINIWENSKVPLGQLLAHSVVLNFTHSIFGRFISMEAFWHYIRSEERDDRIRTMSGPPLKRFAEKLTKVRVPNFRALIMDSNYQKLKQYPDLLEGLKNSTLPLECYYVFKRTDGVRIRPTFSQWLVKGFEEMRKALKENREPSFDFMKDNHAIGIYDGVMTSPAAVAAPVAASAAPVKEFSPADDKELGALLRSAAGITIDEDAVDLVLPPVSGEVILCENTPTSIVTPAVVVEELDVTVAV